MWVARDKNGHLMLFSMLPRRMYNMWLSVGKAMPIDKSLFPDVTWESDPKEVIIVPKYPDK